MGGGVDLESSIVGCLLSALFVETDIPLNHVILLSLPVNISRLAIIGPMESMHSNNWILEACNGNLVCAIMSGERFRLYYHYVFMAE